MELTPTKCSTLLPSINTNNISSSIDASTLLTQQIRCSSTSESGSAFGTIRRNAMAEILSKDPNLKPATEGNKENIDNLGAKINKRQPSNVVTVATEQTTGICMITKTNELAKVKVPIDQQIAAKKQKIGGLEKSLRLELTELAALETKLIAIHQAEVLKQLHDAGVTEEDLYGRLLEPVTIDLTLSSASQTRN